MNATIRRAHQAIRTIDVASLGCIAGIIAFNILGATARILMPREFLIAAQILMVLVGVFVSLGFIVIFIAVRCATRELAQLDKILAAKREKNDPYLEPILTEPNPEEVIKKGSVWQTFLRVLFGR